MQYSILVKANSFMEEKSSINIVGILVYTLGIKVIVSLHVHYILLICLGSYLLSERFFKFYSTLPFSIFTHMIP